MITGWYANWRFYVAVALGSALGWCIAEGVKAIVRRRNKGWTP